MKLLGQSLIPVNPIPYLHLGYISAYAEKITTAPPGYEDLGLFGFLIALAGLAIFLYTRQFTHRAKYLPLVILFGGIIMMGYANLIRVPPHLLSPSATMALRETLLEEEVHRYIVAGKPVPKTAEEIVKNSSDKRLRHANDIWGTPFRIKFVFVDGETSIFIVSAGEDRRFDTKDDRISSGEVVKNPGNARH